MTVHNQSKASQYHAGCERVYQTKVLPAFWAAKERAAKSGNSDDALPFVEINRATADQNDPQHKAFGPVVFVTSTDMIERADFGEGKAGFVTELYLRHAAEAIYKGTHALASAEQVIQWRKEGEERRLQMESVNRKLQNARALTLEESSMPKPITPGAAPAPTFSATLENGIMVSATTPEGLKAAIAALTPEPVKASK